MAKTGDADRDRTGSAGTGDTVRYAPRTLPSIDLDALRQDAGSAAAADPQRRRGTVRLGPGLPPEEENTSKLANPGGAALESAADPIEPDSPSVARERIITPAGASSVDRPRQAASATASLDRLIPTLLEEVFPPDPPLYLPASDADPFDGMLGSTLELKVDPSMFSRPAEKGQIRPGLDGDLRWLSPQEPTRPQLPNSYGWTDDQVSRACLATFREIGAPTGDALLAVGAMMRLEARITEGFVQVGRAYDALAALAQQPQGERLRAILQPTGVLEDSDLLQSLELWKEDRHDARFWADDEGARLKAPRLVGAYLLRKRGEVLSQLPRPLSIDCTPLSRLLELIDNIRSALNERQRLLREHFPSFGKAFATSFLVHRGINAAPGFFWTDAVREEL